MTKKISVFYTASARKDLQKIDKLQSKRIVTTIKKYTNSNPLLKSKKLSGILDGLYRYRIGDYRAIFKLDENNKLIIITILRIKHRKDIYK